MTDQSISFVYNNIFQNVVNRKTEISYTEIKSAAKKIVTSTDYDDVLIENIDNEEFNVIFTNKLTSLTQTEIDNVTAYLTAYPPQKKSEPISCDVIISNDFVNNPTGHACIPTTISQGNTSIYIKKSSTAYDVHGDIVLKNSVNITGEENSNTVLDLLNHSFSTPSLSHINPGGPVTFTHNSTTVTGADTSFLTVVDTQLDSDGYSLYIESNSQIYKVASVESHTSLTLEKPFKGNTQTNNMSCLGYYTKRVYLKNLKIINYGENTFNNLISCTFENITFDGGVTALKFIKCMNITIKDCIFLNSSSSNIELVDCKFIKMDGIRSLRSSGCGLQITSSEEFSTQISVLNSFFENNNKGILVGSSNDNTKCSNNNINIINTQIKHNVSNGLEINNYYNSGYFPFQNTCIGNSITLSQIAFNGGDGAVIKSELTKVINNCIGFNGGNGLSISNRNINIVSNFVCYNALSGIYVTSNEYNIKNNNIIMDSNTVKDNVQNGIYVDDNNNGFMSISKCKVFENGNKSLLIEPTSESTYVCDKTILTENNFKGNVLIGGKESSSSVVEKLIISNNFFENIEFTNQTSQIKFLYNFYDSFVNGNGTGNNLLNGGNTTNN